jgi:hypothetical protein
MGGTLPGISPQMIEFWCKTLQCINWHDFQEGLYFSHLFSAEETGT